MTDPQVDDPILDAHIAFGKAVVALAREHGADDLSLEFDLASSKRFLGRDADYQKVKMTWKEGRHGAKSRLMFHATCTASVKEDV